MFSISPWQSTDDGFYAVVSIQSIRLHEEVYIARTELRLGRFGLRISPNADQINNMNIISIRIMAAVGRLLASSSGLSHEERDRRARERVFGPNSFAIQSSIYTLPSDAVLSDLHSSMQELSGIGISNIGYSSIYSGQQLRNEPARQEALSALEARQVEEALQETECPTIKRALRTLRNL